MSTTTARRLPGARTFAARCVGLTLAVGLGLTGLAAPAHAAEPRPQSGEGTVTITSALTTTPGRTVSFRGEGFALGAGSVGQALSVKFDDAGDALPETFAVRSDGTFTGSVALPAGFAVGEHWLRFLGSQPVVSKHTQKFEVVETLPPGPSVSATAASGGRGADPRQVTVTVGGSGFEANEQLTVSRNGTPLAWTTGTTTSPTLAASADGTVTGARIVFAPGTLPAGEHTVVIGRGNQADPVDVPVSVKPGATFSSLGRGVAGTLTLTNLAPGAVVSEVDLDNATFETPVTASETGVATVDYTIADDAPLGTRSLTVTQSAPKAATFTLSAKVSPSPAPINEDGFTRVETPVGVIEQGLYQSDYSEASDALFVATANVTATSTIYRLDPETLAVEDSVVPAHVEGSSGPIWAAYGIGVDDANGTVWVTNTRQNTVAVYDQDTLDLVQQFPNGTTQHSRDVVVDEARDKVFVTSASEGTAGDGYIDVFDGSTREKLHRIELGARTAFSPMSLDLDEKSGTLYTVSLSSPRAAAIDTVGTTYPVRTINLGLPADARASGVAYDAASNRLLVTSQATDNLLIVDAKTGRTIKDVPTGAGALNVAYDPIHRLAYVSNFGGTTITVVSDAGSVVANLTFPRANHVEEDGRGSVYAVNKDADNTVLKLTPVNLTAATPVVSGSARVGSVLTARPGAWSAGTAFTYQWERNGAAITGATQSTYRIAAADATKRLSVRVTGSRTGSASASRTSSSTATVALGTLTARTPRISGKAKVGQVLTVQTGSWTAGTRLSIRWYAGSKAISGASRSKLRLPQSVKGKRIAVKVTGTKSGYRTVAKVSARTKAVARR